ncbi:unnamed protein product [Ectocarpus sp. 13 AM-2016]
MYNNRGDGRGPRGGEGFGGEGYGPPGERRQPPYGGQQSQQDHWQADQWQPHPRHGPGADFPRFPPDDDLEAIAEAEAAAQVAEAKAEAAAAAAASAAAVKEEEEERTKAAEVDPAVVAVAANLAPVCVSRQLLSEGAYRRLALARQAGDDVEAGLTFEPEEEYDDEKERGTGAGVKPKEEEGVNAGTAMGEGATPASGTEMDGGDNGCGDSINTTPAQLATDDSGGGGGGSPDGAEEEDDLYGDLYGGLDDDGGGGADMEGGGRNGGGGGGGQDGAGGDGGGVGEEGQGAGGLNGGGAVEAGGGDGMAEEVSTRAVMNALKRLEAPIFIPAPPEASSVSLILGDISVGLPLNVLTAPETYL